MFYIKSKVLKNLLDYEVPLFEDWRWDCCTGLVEKDLTSAHQLCLPGIVKGPVDLHGGDGDDVVAQVKVELCRKKIGKKQQG